MAMSWLAIGLLGFTVSAAGAVDAPVILVQAERLVPERLEVHVGEVVTWRAAGGRPLRLELDPHRSGHEVVLRTGEVRTYFRKPGEHWYKVTIVDRPGKALRGTVSVREGQIREERLLICGPESTGRICIAP
jgi:plastocyanin